MRSLINGEDDVNVAKPKAISSVAGNVPVQSAKSIFERRESANREIQGKFAEFVSGSWSFTLEPLRVA